jgi:hypothetical protein
LTILFIGLKLMGKITWSWLWVLSPLWIPTVTVVLVLLAIGAVYGVGYGVVQLVRYASRLREKEKRKVRVISPDNRIINAEFVSREKRNNPWKS